MSEPAHALPSSWRHHHMALVLGMSLLTFFGLLAAAPPAHAHSDIQSISPADQSTVDRAPSEIVLTFTDKVIGQFSQVQVRHDDVALDLPAPTSTDNVVTQALPLTLPSGTYTIVFRIVSADSHPISGQGTFTVTSGADPTTGASSKPPPAPTPSLSENQSAPSSESASPSALVPPGTDSPGASGASITPWLLGGVAMALVAGAAIALQRRNRP